MRRSILGLGALFAGATSPAWAHPAPGFHVHATEVTGLLVVSLLVVGLLSLAGRKPR